MWNPIKWLTSPSIKSWLKVAFVYIRQIITSPEAETFFLSLIAASLGWQPAQVKTIWDIIAKLVLAAETAHPTPGSGDAKYSMVSNAFKLEDTKGIVVTNFDFDYILHTYLAVFKKEQAKKVGKVKI